MNTKPSAIITGATGFLGQHLCQRLLNHNWQVIALGRNSEVLQQLSQQGCEAHNADIKNIATLQQSMSHADVVFHCAALSSPWGKQKDFFDTNVQGTRNVVTIARHVGIKRLVYVSSSSVYFNYHDALSITEQQPLNTNFINHYSATKFAGEQEVMKANSPDFSTTVIRPRGLFGEGDTAIMPRLFKLLERGIFPVLRGGQHLVDLTYVGNVTQAMHLAALSQNANGQCYNISNQQPIKLNEIITMLSEQLNLNVKFYPVPYKLLHYLTGLLEQGHKLFVSHKEPLLTQYSLGLLAYSQTLDNSRAIAELQYNPEVTIEEGVARYVKWHKAMSSH